MGIIFEKKRIWVTVALLLLGIAMMVMGIWRGEMREIMLRTSLVCFDCIGLG
ncbi:MAG: thioredoxin [Lachnospiraceae bacterium]|jgi:hypothetical protein|nr:thioredoxin [Lachnospiraceae bacterium]